LVKDDEKKQGDGEDNPDLGESPSLNRAVEDVLKNVEGEKEVYQDETFKKISSLCVKYIQDEKEVHKRDLKMSIYLKFLDDPDGNIIREILKENEHLTERDMWEMSKSVLDLIEENTDVVEITKEKDRHIYRWKD